MFLTLIATPARLLHLLTLDRQLQYCEVATHWRFHLNAICERHLKLYMNFSGSILQCRQSGCRVRAAGPSWGGA